MPRVKASTPTSSSRPRRPAISPDARMNQLTGLAVDLAEQQLRDGTASSQVITHFLKYATKEKEIELQILERQRDLIEAKTDQVRSQEADNVDYKEVIRAIKEYQGRGEEDEY